MTSLCAALHWPRSIDLIDCHCHRAIVVMTSASYDGQSKQATSSRNGFVVSCRNSGVGEGGAKGRVVSLHRAVHWP